ncbi:hypothetical protein [Bufonid herpesvirus 1]|uniref:hypothetical protein n=1 Tax=Bufonid herpesvirus 1 TaxID=2282206 RepID=UPI000EB6C8CA|nr:hypothetical protein [Bufonid herpesvirus 1]AXF48652.1 hypothetical protein [Bufonid herpesvirus 1]
MVVVAVSHLRMHTNKLSHHFKQINRCERVFFIYHIVSVHVAHLASYPFHYVGVVVKHEKVQRQPLVYHCRQFEKVLSCLLQNLTAEQITFQARGAHVIQRDNMCHKSKHIFLTHKHVVQTRGGQKLTRCSFFTEVRRHGFVVSFHSCKYRFCYVAHLFHRVVVVNKSLV